MIAFIKRFLARHKTSQDVVFTAPLTLEASCILVGDIHGRVDLLNPLLEKLDLGGTFDLVFLGDYVDRGDHSAEVLRLLFELEKSSHVTCLMGNHESMLIEFLNDPKGKGARWLRNGGLQTLASFGVGGVTQGSGPMGLQEAATALKSAMGPHLERWLRALPLTYQNGNLVCVHAALDPELPLSLQKPSTFLWGHSNFLVKPRTDELWVAHGHTVVEEAVSINGRISIDTGAYYSGCLTAAVLSKDEPIRFIDTR